MNKNTLTYVFGSGRTIKIKEGTYKAKEFFYSLFYFSEQKMAIELIEMESENFNPTGIKVFLKIIDKILRKLTNLPFYFCEILNKKNLNILVNSNKVVITNDRLAISLLPFLFYIKVFKNIDIYVIVMGLFSKKKGNIIVNFLQKLFIRILIKLSKNLIFLGKGEYKNSKKNVNKNQAKNFIFLPFSVDYDFWSKDIKVNKNNSQIMFIGNDGNRDYEFLINLAKNMSNFNFVFITKNINKIDLPENVKLINGSWNDYELNDEEIRFYYQSSFLVINPLLETYQPSGQSVSLQSMAAGTGLLITKTEGFWDNDSFKDEESIFFIEKNEIDLWKKKINYLHENRDKLNFVVENAKNKIYREYSLDVFNTKLENIIFDRENRV